MTAKKPLSVPQQVKAQLANKKKATKPPKPPKPTVPPQEVVFVIDNPLKASFVNLCSADMFPSIMGMTSDIMYGTAGNKTVLTYKLASVKKYKVTEDLDDFTGDCTWTEVK